MIIALTGTPGTGKTSIAERLDYETLDLTGFVKEQGLGEQAGEFEVDLDLMVEALEEHLEAKENVVIEGHLSHHYPADLCIVLRCNPDELRDRLSDRDYSDEKIEENVESEILDSILLEAISIQENVFELDTSGKSVEESVEKLEEAIENKETGYGSVDWTSYL